jgi:hypothetical protein
VNSQQGDTPRRTRDAGDISRIDHYFGGLTSCLKAAALCESHGTRLELHSTATNGYNLQVLGATCEHACTFLETYDLDPEGERTSWGRASSSAIAAAGARPSSPARCR